MPSGVTLIFAGFRSRWMIPCSCAASSASRSAWRWGALSREESGRERCDRREFSPSTSSMTRTRRRLAFFEAVDGGDVGMIQGRKDFRLALKPAHPIGFFRELLGQHFDRNVRFGRHVVSPIHFAHSAFAGQSRDQMRVELRTKGNCQELGAIIAKEGPGFEGLGTEATLDRDQSNLDRRFRTESTFEKLCADC